MHVVPLPRRDSKEGPGDMHVVYAKCNVDASTLRIHIEKDLNVAKWFTRKRI